MNLYVGNLPFSTSNEDLAAMFRRFGEVTSAQVITDRDTGRSRGFGFVEMADDDAARAAIEEMNDTDVAGRRLTVNEAKPRAPRRDGGGPRRSGDRGDRGDRGGRSRW
jgi:cold-inducible RNA-binding protein